MGQERSAEDVEILFCSDCCSVLPLDQVIGEPCDNCGNLTDYPLRGLFTKEDAEEMRKEEEPI